MDECGGTYKKLMEIEIVENFGCLLPIKSLQVLYNFVRNLRLKKNNSFFSSYFPIEHHSLKSFFVWLTFLRCSLLIMISLCI